MLAFCDCHVAVLDDRSPVFIQYVLLSELAKRSPAGKHHVRCMVQRSCSIFAVLNAGVLLLQATSLAIGVTI